VPMHNRRPHPIQDPPGWLASAEVVEIRSDARHGVAV
jgi:hypothetical protein